jgi:hypothetical protein
MTIGNWRTQVYDCVQSLLFNNLHRVIRFLVRGGRRRVIAPGRGAGQDSRTQANRC